jgi:AT-binding transcription factor 1
MLENIAHEVGLKKRVVQVWFQNTRARERKGQFRAHSQVINKRCPFCPALFKVKSALESHLTTKHADQCSRGEINIDALPDEEGNLDSSGFSQMGDSSNKSFSNNSMMPPVFPSFSSDMESSLKKYYEESMKRYMSGVQAHHSSQNGVVGKDGLPTDLSLKVKSEGNSQPGESTGDCPLDLSKPVDLSRPMKLSLDHDFKTMMDQGPLTDLSERSLCGDDDSMSECTDNMEDESNPTSPASSNQSGQQQKQQQPGKSKRFRTPMSTLQVKLMKTLFSDYKTPTMAECEMLGREIGLQKRVIQVWFQNARAKEKKHKAAIQSMGGTVQETERPPEECKFCQFKYTHKYSVQDHIFTKKHIDAVKAFLENSLTKSEMSGNASDGEFTVPPVPGASGDNLNNNNNINNNNQGQMTQLQMLQMAGLSLPQGKAQEGKEPQPSPEDMALLQQLYGIGLTNYPQGYMHPALLSATGEYYSIIFFFILSNPIFKPSSRQLWSRA